MRLPEVAAILATLLATPALARTPGEAARLAREAAFDAFFACAVGKPGAHALALDSAYDATFGDRHGRFFEATQGCAGPARTDMLRVTTFLFRGGLARAAWMAGTPAPAAFAPPPVAATAAPQRESEREAARSTGRQAEAVAAAFAACLLARDRPSAETFTRATSGSPEERTAFVPLAALAEPCAVDAPGTGPMSGDRLRAALALQLWAGGR